MRLTRDAPNGLLSGAALGVVTDAWTYDGFGQPSNNSASANGSAVYSAQITSRDKQMY